MKVSNVWLAEVGTLYLEGKIIRIREGNHNFIYHHVCAWLWNFFFFFLIEKGRNYVNFNELPELVTVIYQNLRSWRANPSALLRGLQNFDFNAPSTWITTRNTTVGSLFHLYSPVDILIMLVHDSSFDTSNNITNFTTIEVIDCD